MRKPLFFIATLSLVAFFMPALGFSFDRTSSELSQIHAKTANLDQHILELALHAYHRVERDGQVKNPYLTIIDYSTDSNKKRLWVIDVAHQTLAFNTYVSHGKNSGVLKATHFSNKSGSLASSLGVFLTKQPYIGKHGKALRIDGLEKGFNNNALSRSVVVHAASYMKESVIQKVGRAGRSWGCPALPPSLSTPIVDAIKGGSVIFSYYPQKDWLSQSKYLA